MKISDFMSLVERKNPGEVEFHQAVKEIVSSVIPFIEANPRYKENKILERLIEPDRVIMFRVSWFDDKGQMQVNRGYRVQYSNLIGPYKGGLRFSPLVNLGTIKFLAFEQIFKNALTTLPMGGGKGGSDFDPKGKSDAEVMRFCQSFMTELYRYIGQEVDVPAGDQGVGSREVGYMYGQYKRILREDAGVLTGKSPYAGGIALRPEATGYGLVYFFREILGGIKNSLEGKKVCISGSGNVALYAAEKFLEMGAKVLTVSDRDGTLLFADGIKKEELKELMLLKFEKRGNLKEAKMGRFHSGKKPWGLVEAYDLGAPCATQNEVLLEDAKNIVKAGCKVFAEGANMPTDLEGTEYLVKNGVHFAPGKAANAGGVSVSGLEIVQNSMHLPWTREEVDKKLQSIMNNIYETCVEHGSSDGERIDFIKGANIGGFVRVAESMIAHGLV